MVDTAKLSKFLEIVKKYRNFVGKLWIRQD